MKAIKSFSQALSKHFSLHRSRQETLSQMILGALIYLIDPLKAKGKAQELKDLFEKKATKDPTLKKDEKDARDKKLAFLMDKNNYDNGNSLSKETQDTAYMLKIYGFIYFSDTINNENFPIPAHLKNLRINRKSSVNNGGEKLLSLFLFYKRVR